MLGGRGTASALNSFRRKGNMIYVRLSGRADQVTAQQSLSDFKALVAEVLAEGKNPFVLVDVRDQKLSDVTLEARLAMKEAFRQPYAALAAVGHTKLLEVAMYLIRAGGADKRVRYFTSERRAKAWLTRRQLPHRRGPVAFVVGALLAGAAGVAGLTGWIENNAPLKSIVSSLRPINPMAAVGLVVIACGFLAVYYRRKRIVRGTAVAAAIVGVLALLPSGFTHFDYWLFAAKVHAAGSHTQLADSAAACFLVVGLLLWLREYRQKATTAARIIIAAALLALALFNAGGLLYASRFMYNLSQSFVMALPLALSFAAAAVVLGLDARIRTVEPLGRITGIGWLTVSAIIFMQVATFAAWQQSTTNGMSISQTAFAARTDDISDQVNVRVRAYADALRGFKGLFGASNYVTQGEFESYYKTTDIVKNYPGLRAVSFISQVHTKDLPAFVATHRADTSLLPNGLPHFAIQQQSKSDPHYIVTYVAGTPASSSLGTDLTDTASRRTAFEKAVSSNTMVSSGTIQFTSGGTGFFVTIPVKNEPDSTGTAQPAGFVNVVFTYKDLLNNLLTPNLKNDVRITIHDAAENQPFYLSDSMRGPTRYTTTIPLALADRTWDLQVAAPARFGEAAIQKRAPVIVLVTGQTLTILLLFILVMQINARRRALLLAADITADLQHERNEAIANRQRDGTILAGIAEGLLIFDQNAHIIQVNGAAERLLGYSETELHGSEPGDLLVAYDQKGELIPLNRRPIIRTIEQARVITERLQYQRKDGTRFDVQLTNSPLIINDKIVGAIEIFHDITKERELERLKDEFVSVASHELRTPMGAIRAFVSMILAGDYGPVNKNLAEPLHDIRGATLRLVALVNDLLDVTRIEAGRMRIVLADHSLNPLLHETVAGMRPLAKEKGIRLSIEGGKTAMSVQADADKIKQILTNLIGNALKFTDKGNITVSTRALDDSIEVSVADTGIGITPQDQTRLFAKFEQISSVQAGRPPGTGLGLYISKQISKKMGGDLYIRSSEPGKGSVFAFTLPRTDSKLAQRVAKHTEHEAKLHPDQK